MDSIARNSGGAPRGRRRETPPRWRVPGGVGCLSRGVGASPAD